MFYFLIIKRGYESEYLNAFRQYAFFGTAWHICKVVELLCRNLTVKIKNKEMLNKVFVFVLAIVMLIGGFRYAFDVYMQFPNAAAPNHAYVEKLGGNVKDFHEDIAYASDTIKGKTLFSTFSTAVEVVNDIYQPSRYDYITFTFGDHARKEYVNAFRESNPDYVSIINRDFTRWEGALCGVKWFFYRQLLDSHSYEFGNVYARYLKKTNVSSVVDCDYTLTATQLDNGTVELVVTSDQNDLDIVADVRISYSSHFTGKLLKHMAVNKMVTVTGEAGYFFPKEHFECWFIPEMHDEWYLPILIEEGVGRVVLITIPVECTALDVIDVQVLALYDFEKVFGENNW
ncbi:MAG: hypothetical protein GX222_08600 [Ruminococcaceae bacterium]|nr:hypothetical protein [Oscillospiraceae bacterium]